MNEENTSHLIYLVEDDNSIRELLVYNLKNEGYEVKAFASGRPMFSDLFSLDRDAFVNLFILDILLPDMNGYEILERLKTNQRFDLSSFLMLTALSSEKNKVDGFSKGADDYLTKPFGMKEFLARVRALISRSDQRLVLLGKRQAEEPEQELNLIRYGQIILDHDSRRVHIEEEEVFLTKLEFDLLHFLMQHPSHVMTRDKLLEHVWGFDYEGETRTVDVHVRNLRRKLEEAGLKDELIETVRGVGYRMKGLD
ncbi:MAG: response regulator transcription factor [Eubacteriales bacterium]|nr:response regulator transcription factor [Eubacteriales bacterium]